MRIITDKFDRFIRVYVREFDTFKPETLRFFDIPDERGVSMALGKVEANDVDINVHSILFNKDDFDFKSVKKWMRQHGGQLFNSVVIDPSKEQKHSDFSYQPQEEIMDNTFVEVFQKSIQSVPIFKTGVHNGSKFGEKELEKMADNFNELKKENPDFQIPIKIGHGDDETAAAGWMQNLRVKNGMLFADFVDMTDDVFEMIKSKQFKNRSIELLRNFTNSAGKKLGLVVKGIALLGSNLPAVNLPDIQFTSFAGDQESESIIFEEIEEGSDENNKGDNEVAIEKIIEKEVKEDADQGGVEELEVVEEKIIKEEVKEEMEIKVEEKVDYSEKFKSVTNMTPDQFVGYMEAQEASTKKHDEVVEKYEKEMEETFQKGQKSFIDSLIKENKIEPAERDLIEPLLFSLDRQEVIEFSVTKYGAKKEATVLEVFKHFLTSLPNRGLLRETAQVHSVKTQAQLIEHFGAELGHSKEDLKKGTVHKEVLDYLYANHKNLLEDAEKETK